MNLAAKLEGCQQLLAGNLAVLRGF